MATRVQQRAVLASLVRQAEAIQCHRRTSTRRLIRGRVVEGWPEQSETGGRDVIKTAGHVLRAGEFPSAVSRVRFPAGDDIHRFPIQCHLSCSGAVVEHTVDVRQVPSFSDEAGRSPKLAAKSGSRRRSSDGGGSLCVTPRAHHSRAVSLALPRDRDGNCLEGGGMRKAWSLRLFYPSLSMPTARAFSYLK